MSYIKGTISKIIYRNNSNGYTVGLIKIKESDEEVGKIETFTGVLPEFNEKTIYQLNGTFTTHNKYGYQFQVDSFEIVLPEKKDELVDFLSSDLFPIGEKTAKKIVGSFGEDTIDVILNNKEKLLEIPRLGIERINKINNILKEYQSTSNIVLELNRMGFNTKDSLMLLNKYKDKVIRIIDNNIYDLIDNINLNFKEIDTIAINNKYDLYDERRIEALIIYLLNEITFEQGDTYSFFQEIYSSIIKYLPDLKSEDLEYYLLKLSKQKRVVIKKEKYYLKELYDAEEYIADRIYRLNNMERRKLPKLKEKIKELEQKIGITYDESQKNAIINSLNNNFTITTGGPGTGKTTIIKGIIRMLVDTCHISPQNIALLAPTGRASRKLIEVCNIPAYTIHKYLGWDKDNNTFSHNEINVCKEEYIIVDEASMIDTMLMFSLLKGTRLDSKFIFIGDYYQLPSVSQGQVLKDMIDSEVLDVIKLNNLYRQKDGNYIINLAHEIKNKELSDNFLTKKEDYNFIEVDNDYVLTSIKDIILKALEKGYREKDIQVLAPMYKSQNGIDNLNKMLQEIFNPKSNDKNELIVGNKIYREGDKILELVNDSDNSISNGDLGYIINITNKEKNGNKKNEIIVDFDGNIVSFSPDKFINITHGYAISVHKSQGGEFNMVIIPFVNSFKRMLYNKLIYTAVTRAKSKLILIGSREAFIYGVNNDYVNNRKTTLKEMLIKKYDYQRSQ
ncbi:MAG: ATP-dependent RecD-like DNA helicase [Clostridium sp.]|jgi:exodeoxyribonuclease V alpha subunit|nr:ATP-dependent RecD-like DNA helicase [Clostridium sp.]